MDDTEKDIHDSIVDDLTADETAQMEQYRTGKEPPPVKEAADLDDDAADDGVLDQDASAEDQPKKKDGRVPLRKLMAEEERRKNAERELAETRERFSRADERLNTLAQLMQQRQTQHEPEQPPDPNQDPIGAIEFQRQQNARLEQQFQQQQRAIQEQQALQQIDNGYKRAWSSFASETPDAIDAYTHWTGALNAFFGAAGVPEAQREQMIIGEERRLAYVAQQSGQNPAQVIYNLAKQFGYTPKAATDQAPGETAQRKVDMRAKGQAAAKSLSNAGGQRGSGLPSMEEIAGMSDEEFMELRERIGERGMNKILGAA